MIGGECTAHGLAAVSLRYFNVAGAYGPYGERHEPESHLIPLVLQVALGRREAISVYGEDYPTPDGTCVRDYIHVADLAEAHLLALDAMTAGEHLICNLGNGNGFSVREVVETVRKVTGHPVPEVVAPRRPGDPAVLVASAGTARERLGWTPPAPTWRTSSPTPGPSPGAEKGSARERRGRIREPLREDAPTGSGRPPGGSTSSGSTPTSTTASCCRSPCRTPPSPPSPAATTASCGCTRPTSTAGSSSSTRLPWSRSPAATGRPTRRVVWALREAGHPVTGADVHLASTVPTGAGLSSSAALEVVTALALNDLFGLGLSRPELARIAQRAENAFVGVPCGIMDQMASACAEEGHALHLDTRDLSYRQVPFDPAAEGLTLLVVDTRVKHALGDGAYAERRAGCEAGARALGVRALREVDAAHLPEALGRLDDEKVRRYVRHVVSDNARVERTIALLDAGDPGRSARSSPRATPPSGTTCGSPAPNWTWWSGRRTRPGRSAPG